MVFRVIIVRMGSLQKSVQSSKDLIRKALPKTLVKPLAYMYRRVRAFCAAAVFGFPGKRLKIIGVTGTNGKTSTSTYIASILEANGHKVGVSSTAFFQIGNKKWTNATNFTADYTFQTQKFLFKCWMKRVDYVVLEVTAHGLDQFRGIYGIEYVGAVMTNLTQDHLDYFKTMENYAAAKAKLFKKDIPAIALNFDDEWFEYYNQFPATEQKMTFGQKDGADCHISDIKTGVEGSSFILTIDHTLKLKMNTKLSGVFNVYNAAAAASLTYLLHVKRASIVKGIANVELVPGRMQPVETDDTYSVIVDYAHTPDALENVLTTVKGFTNGRVILVFGATGDRDTTKRPIMGQIASKLADRIILTDEEPYSEDPASIRAEVLKGIKAAKGEGKTHEIADRREGIAKAIDIARRGDTVLITGMGHQEFMKTGGHTIAWNDATVTSELIAAKKQKQKAKSPRS